MTIEDRGVPLLVPFILLLSLATSQTTLSTSTTLPPYSILPLSIQTPLLSTSPSLTLTVSSSLLYSATLSTTSSVSFDLINFSPLPHSITIALTSPTSTSLTADSLLTLNSTSQPEWYAGVLTKRVTSGYMLPFNLLSQSNSKVIVNQLANIPTPYTYNLAPYMSTYWTEIQAEELVLPFIPFLSECSLENSHVLLNSLFTPHQCLPQKDGMHCIDQHFSFQCIIQELEVSNVNNQFWFNRESGIIFYLFPTPLSPQILTSYADAPDSLTEVRAHHHSSLIPLVYTRDSSSPTRINHLVAKFQVGLDQTAHPRILTAFMKGTLQEGINSPDMQVQVEVDYLSPMEKFSLYYYGLHWYFVFGGEIVFCLLVILWLCQRLVGRVSFNHKLKYLLAPTIKGLGYALLTAGFYFLLVYMLLHFTHFRGVDPVFGSASLEGDELRMNSIGRTGLGIVFAGLYLLMAAIRQTSNVNSSDDMRRRLEGEEDLGDTQQQIVESIDFLRMNLFSQKKRILLGMLIGVCFNIYLFFNFMGMDSLQIALIQLLLVPLMESVISVVMRVSLLKELLYMCGFFLSFNLGISFYLFKADNLWVFLGLYFCRLIHTIIFIFIDEVLLSWLCRLIHQHKQSNVVTQLIYSSASTFIQSHLSQSEYERSLFFTTILGQQILNILLFPICTALLLLTQDTHMLWDTLYITTSWVSYPLAVIVCLAPAELYALFLMLELMKRKGGIRIQEILRFNSYKLKKKKLVWMNDQFILSKHLHFLYKELEKFGFSSQLYFTVTLIALALFIIYLGVITVLNSKYLPFTDPATLPIFLTVFVLGDMFSIIASFLAVKLKLYAKNDEKIIVQSLAKTGKYLKHDDTQLHLELHAVKDYFLIFNKEWVVANLNRIFSKEELEHNNSEIINKYKKYKSLFKQRQIDQKRRKKKKDQCNPSLFHETNPAHKQLPLARKHFETIARPIVYCWYYLAKQHLYLKRIVLPVQREKMKEVCEYCNMEVELESIEKRQFEELVSEFRVLNVGRMFDEKAFLEFYRINQEYTTICVECREKNLHLQSRISKGSKEGKLVLAWLMAARSRLLHQAVSPEGQERREAVQYE